MTATVTTLPNLAQQLGVQVGTIFSRSWGYDQTNVNYYVVTAVTPSGKSVRLREIGLTTVEDDGPSTRVVANAETTTGSCAHCGQFIRDTREFDEDGLGHKVEAPYVHLYGGEKCQRHSEAQEATTAEPRVYLRRLAKGYNGKAALNWNSYSSAFLWDGQSQYQTGAGWGH